MTEYIYDEDIDDYVINHSYDSEYDGSNQDDDEVRLNHVEEYSDSEYDVSYQDDDDVRLNHVEEYDEFVGMVMSTGANLPNWTMCRRGSSARLAWTKFLH